METTHEGGWTPSSQRAEARSAAVGYDRAKEVKEFDDTKLGVKGLVDAGVTTIPRFFRHPTSALALPRATTNPSHSIPTVDLSLPRPRAVELASAAAREWGFFLVTNHGIPLDALSAALSAVRAFHELPDEAKAAHYNRDGDAGVVSFNSNFDLYSSPAASWLDTLRLRMGPTSPPDAEMMIPEVCRRELWAWEEHARGLAARVMGLLSEGLGVEAGRLEGLKCLEGCIMLCHYYPYCPQPELTLGLLGHTDRAILTVVVQNEVNGLLVKRESAVDGGGDWVEVDPIPGSIVVNVGDTLQMISNDEYKSVEHKVMANPHRRPRVSIAAFYSPDDKDASTIYGPLRELVSQGKPARYREFTMSEATRVFFTEERRPRSLQERFKL